MTERDAMISERLRKIETSIAQLAATARHQSEGFGLLQASVGDLIDMLAEHTEQEHVRYSEIENRIATLEAAE
jgi:hypothetical protein